MTNDPSPVPLQTSRSRLLKAVPFVIVFLAGVTIPRWIRQEPPAGSAQPAQPPETKSTTAPPASVPRLTPDLMRSPILPILANKELDPGKVALGKRLFHDAGLSKDGTISCASCHDLASGGDDGRAVSVGVGGAHGSVNAPTVLNASLNFRQFWDGRARTLEDQINGPIQHPAEMAMAWDDLVRKLGSDAEYAAAFQGSYHAGPTPDSIRDAIATFERSLLTPGCAFDRYLFGDEQALTDEARAGYELFASLGCVTCHQGMNAGGNMFQPLGKMSDYFAGRGTPETTADLGRFNVTGEERDKHTFKVPSLRNVELTAPYFHDGSIATLEEAIQVMADVQLGEELADTEVHEIAAFLRSLTGQQPAGE